MTQKLCAFDKPDARRLPTSNTEGQHATSAFGQILLCQLMIRVVWQTCVLDPGDQRMVVKELRNRQGIGAVTIHAQR